VNKTRKRNILIVGAGRGGTALIKVLKGDALINIIAVVDKNSRAPGIRLARKLGIQTSKSWTRFLKNRKLNEVIDVTGDEGTYRAIQKEAPKHVDVMSGASALLMWSLVEERYKKEQELLKLMDELGERARELNCLYGISALVEKPGISLEGILEGTVRLIISSFKYPEFTCARIILDGQHYKTKKFRKTVWGLSSTIRVFGRNAGSLEVFYLKKMQKMDDAPFSKEEKVLIRAVVERLGKIVERKNVEAEKNASEERFRRMFENMADGVIIATAETKRIYSANKMMLKMLGYSGKQLEGLSIESIHPENSWSYIKKAFQGQLHREIGIATDIPMLKKNGKVIYADINSFPLVMDGRDCLLGVVRDATERRRNEERLEQAAVEWEKTFDSIADLVFIQDADYTITKVNRAFADVMGMKPEDIIGKKCYRLLHNRNKPWPGCPFEKTRRDSKAHTEEVEDPNIKIPLLVTSSPLFDDKGNLAGSVHIAKNITEIKKVAEENRRFRMLVDHANDAIFVIEPESGIILDVNETACISLGYKRDELLKMRVKDIEADLPNDYLWKEHVKIVKDAGHMIFEGIHRRKDGTTYPVDASIRYIPGEVDRMLVTVRDVSDRKRAEKVIEQTKDELEIQAWGLKKANEGIKNLYREMEGKNVQLRALDEMKSEFISTVSHELRTPLSITKEGISLILDGIAGGINEKQKDILSTARDNIDRLARIINELLDISRIETGRVELKYKDFNLIDEIKQVCHTFDRRIRSKGLKLKLNVPDGEVRINADEDRLSQVFTNLIGNSLKFTEKGYIDVSVEVKDDVIECSVADTGEGVSEDDVPMLFDKFRQFGRTAGAGDKGTGLGLSIVKGIIEMHSGTIRAENEPGKGMKITFTLPRSVG